MVYDMNKSLDVVNLKTNFYTYAGIIKALDGINFHIEKETIMGLVGETGCGKTVTSLSIMRLILPPGKIESGKLFFRLDKNSKHRFIDLLQETESSMRAIRGNYISMIFQEPAAALNPVYSVGEQIAESFLIHQKHELYQEALASIQNKITERKLFFLRKLYLMWEKKICTQSIKKPQSLWLQSLSIFPFTRPDRRRLKKIALEKSVAILRSLNIPQATHIINRYPHQLSGGMQQRVMIAIAVACKPELLIADEPTSNLDVITQAQIIELIKTMKEKIGASILFISHDLGVIHEMCSWVAVMYAGTICELATVEDLFKNPLHPYTKALLQAIPAAGKVKLTSIKGNIPSLINPPSGCRFHPRCSEASGKCAQRKPEIAKIHENHLVACFLYKN